MSKIRKTNSPPARPPLTAVYNEHAFRAYELESAMAIYTRRQLQGAAAISPLVGFLPRVASTGPTNRFPRRSPIAQRKFTSRAIGKAIRKAKGMTSVGGLSSPYPRRHRGEALMQEQADPRILPRTTRHKSRGLVCLGQFIVWRVAHRTAHGDRLYEQKAL